MILRDLRTDHRVSWITKYYRHVEHDISVEIVKQISYLNTVGEEIEHGRIGLKDTQMDGIESIHEQSYLEINFHREHNALVSRVIRECWNQ